MTESNHVDNAHHPDLNYCPGGRPCTKQRQIELSQRNQCGLLRRLNHELDVKATYEHHFCYCLRKLSQLDALKMAAARYLLKLW